MTSSFQHVARIVGESDHNIHMVCAPARVYWFIAGLLRNLNGLLRVEPETSSALQAVSCTEGELLLIGRFYLM